jgi:hypothetical protein
MAKSAIIEADPIDLDDILDTGNGDEAPNVLVQIAQAISAYPATFVELEFIDVDPASGDVINTNEVANFRLRVHNRGPLTMRDVRIKIVGKNGTKVKNNGALSQFASDALTNSIDTVAGHNADSPNETEVLQLKAPTGEKAAGTDLVEAYIDSWNGDWQHTLNTHSEASTAPNGVFESAVEQLND